MFLCLDKSNIFNIKLTLWVACILSFFPRETFAQAPALGSSQSFVLFTAVGAFTANGSNVIYGDIGTNNGAYTVPGSITHAAGNVHVADATSSAAATDISTAYTFLGSLTCDTTLGTPLGNGRVLTGGFVYCITTAAVLNGNLILDGQNIPGVVFNININGALSTNPLSTITLINGASACNVYWHVNGAVQMGANSVFVGTVIANGEINLLNQVQLQGRALSLAGQVSANKNQLFGCDGFGILLSAELLYFNAKPIGSDIQISWSTASENNNQNFTLQRSADAKSFENLTVMAGSGNSNTIHHYSTLDTDPLNGNAYYRLKMTDFFGNISYSEIIGIAIQKSFTFQLFPNPFGSSISISLAENDANQNYVLKIYNILGEEKLVQPLTESVNNIATENLISGIYFYQISKNEEIIQSGKILAAR